MNTNNQNSEIPESSTYYKYTIYYKCTHRDKYPETYIFHRDNLLSQDALFDEAEDMLDFEFLPIWGRHILNITIEEITTRKIAVFEPLPII